MSKPTQSQISERTIIACSGMRPCGHVNKLRGGGLDSYVCDSHRLFAQIQEDLVTERTLRASVAGESSRHLEESLRLRKVLAAQLREPMVPAKLVVRMVCQGSRRGVVVCQDVGELFLALGQVLGGMFGDFDKIELERFKEIRHEAKEGATEDHPQSDNGAGRPAAETSHSA